MKDEISALTKAAEELGDEVAMLLSRLDAIKHIIDTVENRAMSADGPVTNTRDEMTDKELQRIYRLAGGTIQS